MVINNLKKSNNKGSTLIMVLIIVSFIAILGTVCITTAMINFKMKVADREAKKTFYTDEQAIDEIYNGLGKLSMQIFQKEYQAQMENMVQTKVSKLDSKITNKDANINLRKNFTITMMNKLTNTNVTWIDGTSIVPCTNADKDNLRKELNSFVEHSYLAKVISIDNIKIEHEPENSSKSKLAIYTIRFNKCVVQYVNESGYISNVTFDGAVALPDVVVKFTQDNTDMLKSFENFALIGNSSIEINNNIILNINSGGMYAGGNHLNLGSGSSINASNSTIVSKGDINLFGATLSTINNSNIWCSNIIASSDPKTMGKKSIFTLDKTCKSYVKDDIQIDGDESDVTVSGEYYGYGYEGFADGADNSSAIVVNGQGASVHLIDIQTLVLGGRAYVNIENGVGKYMTGESLALKGDQEVYLVPSSLMANGMSNPYSINSTPNINITRDNFFGYKYLKPSSLYTTYTVGNQIYAYLNFNSEEDSTNYFKTILNDSVFDSLCDTMGIKSGTAAYEAYTQTRNYMRSILLVNMYSLKQSAIVKKSTALNTKIYTNGTLINADIDNKIVSDVVTDGSKITGIPDTTLDAFVVNSNDLSNRYSLICKILCSPSMYKMTNGSYDIVDGNKVRSIMNKASSEHDIIIDGKDIDISTLDGNDTFKNIINVSHLENQSDEVSKVDYGNNNFLYTNKGLGSVIVKDSNFPGASIGGIIISEGDVIVEKSFNGLIISRGKIIVANGATINNNVNGLSLDAFINSDKAISDYFMAFNNVEEASGNGIGSIEGVTYKDIINFGNWTKTK